MVRREFLARAAGVAAVTLGGGGSAWAYKNRKRRASTPPSKLDRIAISSWSLHNYFRATRESSFKLPGQMLALLDFPEAIFDRYRVRHLEFCASQFPSTEPVYLRELKSTLGHVGASVVNLAIDIDACGPDGTFSDADRAARLAACDLVKPWVDVAHGLGVKSVSAGPGKVDADNLAQAAESYKVLAAYAQSKGIRVAVENRIGFGEERPEDITKLVRTVGPGRLGVLPNFAGFPGAETRAQGLKVLLPQAQGLCHVGGKSQDTDGSDPVDLSQAVGIAKAANFSGIYSIAFDGPGDPYREVQKILDQLLRYV